MNDENLVPNDKRTPSERRENARKAGRASGQKRRALKTWKELTREVLNMPIKPGKVDRKVKSLAEAKGKNLRVQDAMILAQTVQAMKGNTKSFGLLAELSGLFDMEAPTQQPLTVPDDTTLIIPAFDGLSADIKRHLHTHYWLKGGCGSTKSSFISLLQSGAATGALNRKMTRTVQNELIMQSCIIQV